MDIDINNSPDVGNNNSSSDGAVIALSVVLALVLLGIIAGLLYYKRRSYALFHFYINNSIQTLSSIGRSLHSSIKR